MCAGRSRDALRVAGLWVIRRRGRQKFRRSSEDLVTPQPFADPRLACALASAPAAQRFAPQRGVARAPRAGVADKRSPEGGAQAGSRERRAWMPGANVRRRGTDDPEATFEQELQVAGLRMIRHHVGPRSHARDRSQTSLLPLRGLFLGEEPSEDVGIVVGGRPGIVAHAGELGVFRCATGSPEGLDHRP